MPRRWHQCARLSPRAAIQPVARQRRAVVFQPGESRKLLAGLDRDFVLRIGDVGERLAVDLLRDLRQRRIASGRCTSNAAFNIGSGNLPPSF